MLLVMVVLCGVIQLPTKAAASNDYTQWRQGDAAWNQAEAWPASQYPSATMRYMSQAGCLVTSIAMLLRHYNVVTDSNVNNFNPWICNEELKAAGAFTAAADLKWAEVKNAFPGFVYQGCVGYSASQLVSLYNQGYACIVAVNGEGHFVAVNNASNSSNITIMDPGWGYTSLSNFGSVNTIYYFAATPSPTNAAPVGAIEISGGTECIDMYGWVYNPDNLDEAVHINVYVDDVCIIGFYADLHRPEVGSFEQYHGFRESILYNVEETGVHNVKVYAIDYDEGHARPFLLGEQNVTVTDSGDTEGPVISNVRVIPDIDGYTVICDVTDESGIQKVIFPSWTSANGQDDLEGSDGSWPYLDIWKGEVSNGTASFRVNRSDHNNEWGKYRTDIYAFDNYGNASMVGVSAIIENNGPEISEVLIVPDSMGYTVSCIVSDESEIVKVQFPSWSENNGQDDLLYAGDGGWKEKNLYLGTFENGVAHYHVDISEHNYDTGIYHTHIYAFDALGNETIYEIDDIEFVDSTPPIIGKVTVAEVTKEGFWLECEASDNIGIESFEVYLDPSYGYSKSYEVTIEENIASWFVPFSDHDYKVNCTYYGTYETYDVNGNSRDKMFEVYVAFDNERNITYHLDGGTNHTDNPQVYSILNPYINLQAPTKEGYTFVEWYMLDANNNKVTLTSTTELSGEAIEVYASWKCNHAGGEGNVIKEATCVAEGERNYTCSQCGDTKTEEIAITDHNYEDGTCGTCGAEDPNYEDVAAKITVNKAVGTAGSTVAVNVVISENPGIVSATLRINYDSTVLTLIEVVDAGKLGVQSHKPQLTSPYTLVWVNDTAIENYNYNGTIVTLKFQIADGAELGDYAIDISYDYNNHDIYNASGEKVKFAMVDGTISVIDTIIGDVNSDGLVNNLDRMILTRYLADWEGYDENIDLVAADVNSDGLVNNLDRMILTRHLADWEGYETIPYTN